MHSESSEFLYMLYAYIENSSCSTVKTDALEVLGARDFTSIDN